MIVIFNLEYGDGMTGIDGCYLLRIQQSSLGGDAQIAGELWGSVRDQLMSGLICFGIAARVRQAATAN